MPDPSKHITVYHLEMNDQTAFVPKASPPEFEVALVSPADFKVNRDFYSSVGEPWNWIDRLVWSGAQWQDYVQRDSLKTWIGRLDNEPAGYFELESQAGGDVEIKLFGLLPQFIGRGLGGTFLSQTIASAWNLEGTKRVWVHTCTDDHEHALDNYRQRGFEIFKTETNDCN